MASTTKKRPDPLPVTVKLPTIMRRHVGGLATVEGNGSTVRELLDDLESRYPGLKESIVGGDEALHRFVNVYVNDEDIRFLRSLETEVHEGDTVSVLPAVAGGASQ